MEGKAEQILKDFGKRLDSMISDLEDLKDNLENQYGDRWEEINKSKDKIENEYQQFRERNKDRFEEAESSLERAGKEIKKALDAIFSNRSKTTTNNQEKEPSSEH